MVEVSLKTVWENMCSYLYLERLTNEDVFMRAFVDGVRDGSFGFSRGKDNGEHVGFAYGEEVLAAGIDAGMLVLSKAKAEELDAARKCPKCGKFPCVCRSGAPVCPVCHRNPCVCQTPPPACPKCGHSPCTCPRPAGAGQDAKRFWGSIELDPLNATLKFADVMNEVVSILNGRPGVDVKIKVDIAANSREPFDRNAVVRPVTENCVNLGFVAQGFEAE